MTCEPTSHDKLLADLCARVQALETWQLHQSQLLDQLINGAPPVDDSDIATAELADADDIDMDGLIIWVNATVTSVIARPLRGELIWCPLWPEHTEAVFRLEALRRAWGELAPEPGASMSIWIRDHLDPCLRELMSPTGPFADCASGSRFRGSPSHSPLATLPVARSGHRLTRQQ